MLLHVPLSCGAAMKAPSCLQCAPGACAHHTGSADGTLMAFPLRGGQVSSGEGLLGCTRDHIEHVPHARKNMI